MGAAPGGRFSRPPERWETGFKDTVVAYPAEITRIKAVFDISGLYVWHCHILEHEDNEMMRPYFVGGAPPGQARVEPVQDRGRQASVRLVPRASK
jgi:hypothetical protein